MGWGALFFSFSGRINRAKYWLASLLLIPAFLLLVFMLIGPVLMAGDTAVGLAVIPLIVVGIAVFISGLAIATKRLHDRDKSALWILLFYVVPGLLQGIGDELGDMGLVLYIVSFAISIWGLIELGFLRGTVGANRYGPDPLAPPSQPVAPVRSLA